MDFPPSFTNGNNIYDFVYLSLDDELPPERRLLLKDITCSYMTNPFYGLGGL